MILLLSFILVFMGVIFILGYLVTYINFVPTSRNIYKSDKRYKTGKKLVGTVNLSEAQIEAERAKQEEDNLRYRPRNKKFAIVGAVMVPMGIAGFYLNFIGFFLTQAEKAEIKKTKDFIEIVSKLKCEYKEKYEFKLNLSQAQDDLGRALQQKIDSLTTLAKNNLHEDSFKDFESSVYVPKCK